MRQADTDTCLLQAKIQRVSISSNQNIQMKKYYNQKLLGQKAQHPGLEMFGQQLQNRLSNKLARKASVPDDSVFLSSAGRSELPVESSEPRVKGEVSSEELHPY